MMQRFLWNCRTVENMKKILIMMVALVGFAVAEAYRASPISAQSYENSNANSAVSAAVTVSTMAGDSGTSDVMAMQTGYK